MNPTFTRAQLNDAVDYACIAEQVASRFNCVATTVVAANREILKSVVYMIKVGDQTVGFVSYVLLSPTRAYISEVQVVPSAQNKRIGGAALQFILSQLETFRTIELLTHPESQAQRLYERVGFKRNGETIENYEGTGEPRIRMVLER